MDRIKEIDERLQILTKEKDLVHIDSIKFDILADEIADLLEERGEIMKWE